MQAVKAFLIDHLEEVHNVAPHLDKLLALRKKISDYGYQTGRTNDAEIERMERDFMGTAIELCDTWRLQALRAAVDKLPK